MRRYTSPEKTVLQVVSYAAVFGDTVPVSWVHRFQQSKYSPTEIETAISALVRKNVLRMLSKTIPTSLLQKKWRSVGRAITFLSQFPTVESIWVTGGLAIGNIREADDVDLMIITRANSLWFTRTGISLADLLKNRIRRRADHDELLRDKWCCNLWLDSGFEALAEDQRSLYSAREVVQAIPVYQRGSGKAQAFLVANAWVQDILPKAYEAALRRAHKLPTRYSGKAWVPTLFNALLFQLHFWRMRSYIQHEVVELHRAFFHPGKRSRDVQQKYEKILEKVLNHT